MSALDGVPVCTHETIPDTPCRVAEAQAEIYYSSYQECAHSVILLPGFDVMPQWFLAGALSQLRQSCTVRHAARARRVRAFAQIAAQRPTVVPAKL